MCATTMRIGRTSDWRRIRRQVGQPRYVLRWEARFAPSLDSADCTTVTPSRPRLRQLRLPEQLSLLQSRTAGAALFCREPSLVAWSAWSNIGPEQRINGLTGREEEALARLVRVLW